ncbi:hypothetical protein P0136_09400 [Lentisphaerota bacterium ZTH]|nr:hypothetical protein JYG24_13090 [Lentisphaerota bacterium]WET05579.1 hypothetical protein P0136_09400 [Lentisphaerota bacterium ZTH]
MKFKSLILVLSALLLPLLSFGDDKPRFGVAFCDYLTGQGVYSASAYGKAVEYACDNFPIIRTTTDFGTGSATIKDEKDIVVQLGGNSKLWNGDNGFLPPYAQFQQKIWETNAKEHPEKVILEIENPEKWLAHYQSAMNYVYQYVLPMMNGMSDEFWRDHIFKEPNLIPRYKVNAWSIDEVYQYEDKDRVGYHTYKAGDDRYNHVIGIIVGHEVGNVMQDSQQKDADMFNRCRVINKLKKYIDNLNQALEDVGLKDKIYVTTTISVGFAEGGSQHNLLYTLDGSKFQFNHGTYTINAYDPENEVFSDMSFNFEKVISAMEEIKNQQYSGDYNMGLLVSMYPCWNNNCGDLVNADAVYRAYEVMYKGILDALPEDLQGLKISFGEAGAPVCGSSEKFPHKASQDLQNYVIEATARFAKNYNSVPLFIFWSLFDDDRRNTTSPDTDNPNYWFGLYDGTLSQMDKGQAAKLRVDLSCLSD